MHDSFGQEATSYSHPQQYQPSPQPKASPMSHSAPVSTSPRRRRRRRGSLDRNAMLPFATPPLTASVGAGSDPPPLPPNTSASAAASSLTATSRARPPRRKHGSFLESSSTSCCLNDIVEETENTESSAAAPDDFQGDAADDLDSSTVEMHSGGDLQWSGRRVRFGHVEIRTYGVTLDQVGGYGLEGKPVLCPLTLDWRYDGSATVRKPAILFGYTSYFRQVKLRPTTVDERRAWLGVLHHMRQPQVKRWEYRSLLYQMAALQSNDCLPDRWHERSDCDDFDDRAVPGDRVPSEPTRRTADVDALTSSWRESNVEFPSERGVDLPIVPMQWIDHDSRPETVRSDTWTPLDPVWIDVHSSEKKKSNSYHADDESHGHAREGNRHCMPTMPSLWLQDRHVIVRTHEDNAKDDDDPNFASTDDFQVIPFEPIVASKVKEKESVRCSPSSARTKEWKRSPPGRSNVKKVLPCDIPSDHSSALPMPRVPFQWITDKSEECRTQDSSAIGGESGPRPRPDSEVPPVSQPSEFRMVPFEDLVTAACLSKQRTSHIVPPDHPTVTARSLDETEWRRCFGSSSTMWWTRNETPTKSKSHDDATSREGNATSIDDRSLESLSWLEELTKLHRSKHGSVPASVPTTTEVVPKEAEQLWLSMVSSTHSSTGVSRTTKGGGKALAPNSRRVEWEEASRHPTLDGKDRDPTSRSSSKPTSVTGMSRAQLLLCLYQDLPRLQVTSPKRTTDTVPFVWLPSSRASESPNEEGC